MCVLGPNVFFAVCCNFLLRKVFLTDGQYTWYLKIVGGHELIGIFDVRGCVRFSNVASEWLVTHWGRVTHICVSELTIIGSDNGLSPGRRQAIIRTNAGILLIRPLGINFSEFVVEILIFSFKKRRLKVSSAKWRLFCLGLNELTVLPANRNPGLKLETLVYTAFNRDFTY